MADIEEPQFTSLSARIAALKQQGVGQNGSHNGVNFNKRPAPPLPTSTNRPLPTRGQTTNNPPITTYGSTFTTKVNEPIGAKGQQQLLPPPPIDRDQARPSPPVPARNAAPLPTRKASQPSPALPPRRPSTQMVRKGSNSSMASNLSTMSGLSLSRSVTSTSSVDTQRKLPPAFDQAKLPPLPPTRRELEESGRATKVPLISTKSAPAVPLRAPPAVGRDSAPKMPPRPSLPLRPTKSVAEEPEPSKQPPRRLPPRDSRNILQMGFSNKPKPVETEPTPPPRTYSRPASPLVQELTSLNFDSIVMSGKAALVDFYAPYCKYCKEIEPIWEQLGEDFAFASDKLVIAKCDVDVHKSFMNRFDIQGYPTIMFFDGHNETPEKYPYMRDRESLTKYIEKKTRIDTTDGANAQSVPPTVNLRSKPKPAAVTANQVPPGCLLCRDFSAPDHVASQYPRQSLPRSGDMTAYLASVLCDPFPSATDKARAIFTWLHHNIAYDVAAFFGNNVKYVDPKDTITSGVAVCGGYAGLFCAIALKAGLEAIEVTGHGKGFGHETLKPGDPVPPRSSNHAWNAVRIDGGVWKLVESCWGAGYITTDAYTKRFAPSHFTMSNDEFGLRHFPSNDKYFFRSDGRVPTWEEYFIGPTDAEPLQIFGDADVEGLSQTSFSPAAKQIRIDSDEVVRFQFSKICEHWDHERNGPGKPFCMILKVGGVNGTKTDHVPFERNEMWWWCDVRARDLGKRGGDLLLYMVTNFDGRDGRGLTKEEFERKKGRCGMSFGGICKWELV